MYDKINRLGIGAQGLGGLTTVLDVKLRDFPTHAASLPVALIPNCAATRHLEFELDGSGPARLEPPRLEDWPAVTWEAGPDARRVDLDRVSREDIAGLQPGERLLLSGKLLTGRDAAHKRIADLLRDDGKHQEAIECWRRALELEPEEYLDCTGRKRFFRLSEYNDGTFLDAVGLVYEGELPPMVLPAEALE